MTTNFTFSNNLTLSIGIEVEPGPTVWIKPLFVNSGNKDFLIEPGLQLYHESCWTHVRGPSNINCRSNICFYESLEPGLAPLFKLGAGATVEKRYQLEQCNFVGAVPGSYTARLKLSFYCYETTQSENNSSTEQHSVDIEDSFEILEEHITETSADDRPIESISKISKDLSNSLHFDLSIRASKTLIEYREYIKGPTVSIEVTFSNTGDQDLVIEPGWNLGHTSCGSVSVIGPSKINCMGDICVSYLLGRGLGSLLVLKANTSIEQQYTLGQCDFSNAIPGIYTAGFGVSFYQHNSSICQDTSDGCYNHVQIKPEKEFSFRLQNNFEILKEHIEDVPPKKSFQEQYIESDTIPDATPSYGYYLGVAALAGVASYAIYHCSH